MSYDADIPQPEDIINQSVTQINTNFNQANVAFTINHYAFDDTGPNKGKHKFASFPSVNGTVTQTDENEMNIFSNGLGALTNLFYLEQNSEEEEGKIRQISGPITTGYGSYSVGGSIPLLGGMMLKFGNVNITSDVPNNFTFTTETGSPFPANVFSAYAQTQGSFATFSGFTKLETDGFTIQGSAGLSGQAVFIAIGN